VDLVPAFDQDLDPDHDRYLDPFVDLFAKRDTMGDNSTRRASHPV
jgi:hypothetical protein